MDACRFDRLTRALTSVGSRRGVLGLLGFLAAIPGFGGLLGLPDPEAAEARKKRNRKKKKRKKCRSRARVCAGKCGRVTTRCKKRKKTFNCGSCECTPACGVCQVCRRETGQCAPAPAGTSCGDPGQVCYANGTCACDARSCGDCHVCDVASGQCMPRPEGTPCGHPGQVCQADGACACDASSCANPTPICDEGRCVACESNPECGAGAICLDDGACQVCDITCPGGTCAGTELRAAINAGGTVYVCPGTYTGNFNVGKSSVTVIGAGQGDDERFSTILDGQGVMRVIESGFTPGNHSIALHRLRITGGSGGLVGGGVLLTGVTSASFVDCTITGNSADGYGGGIASAYSVTTLTRCTVSFNEASDPSENGHGGGIYAQGSGKLTLRDCRIANNTARSGGGGIYNDESLVELINCEVTENTRVLQNQEGGGLAGLHGEAELKNSFVWNNSAPDCSGNVTGSRCGVPPPA